MTETKYLKIISSLFGLTGYAVGILKAFEWGDYETNLSREKAVAYLQEQQNLILMQLDEVQE